MECLYVPVLNRDQLCIELTEAEELRHVRALRLRIGERVALTNGQGLLVEAEFRAMRLRPVAAVFQVLRELPNPELPVPVALALGILQERERLEFALEKAVELGVREIVLLRTHRTQPVSVRLSRLQGKLRAAVKQAHRAWFPQLHEPIGLQDCCQRLFPLYPRRLVADTGGVRLQYHECVPTLIMVGPEGGWAPEELELLRSHGATIWSLGMRRLRSETAVVATLSLVSTALLGFCS